MKNVIYLLLISLLFSSCSATWSGVKEDSSDAWKNTKEVSQDAYDSTKDAINKATE